jgi:arylsulfatase A-like enzyme
MKGIRGALAALVCCTALVAQDRTNLLFIAIDDQNDWVGPMHRHSLVQTPHLDAVAKRGMTFLNAHC